MKRGAVALGGGLILGAGGLAALWRRRLRSRPAAPWLDPETMIREPHQLLRLTRLANGDLRFHWTAHAAGVALRGDLDPMLGGDLPVLATAAAATELIIPDPFPGQRAYYRLDFAGGAWDGRSLTVSDRYLPLGGAGNARDMGGYETVDGRVVRWGRLFRSGDLGSLGAADLAFLSAMELRQVCDLRSTAEREARPDRYPDPTAYVPLPVYENAPRGALLRTMLFQRNRLGEVMAASYPRMLREGAAAYGALLRLAADEANHPLLFHCTAGKDRAGIAAALLLDVLGVPWETILADYSLSNRNFAAIQAELTDNEHLARLRISAEDLRVVSVADPAWLRGLWQYITAEYGDVRGYVLGPAGLDEATLDRLRVGLLM